MTIVDAVDSSLAIIAASTLAPLIVYKFYLPWISKTGKKSTIPTVFLLTINFIVYAVWYYFAPKSLLLSLPIFLSLVLESVFLLISNYRLFVEVVKINTIVSIPYLLMISNSESTIYLVMGHLIIQVFLYLSSFALLKSTNSKIPFSVELKSRLLDSKSFKKSSDYSSLKKAGIKQVSTKDLILTVLKYGSVVVLLYVYSRKFV